MTTSIKLNALDGRRFSRPSEAYQAPDHPAAFTLPFRAA